MGRGQPVTGITAVPHFPGRLVVEVEIRYVGGLRCEATHGPSGAALQTDAPVDNHGQGAAFSPTDLCATSLGVCMLTVMGIRAEADGIDLSGTRVTLRKGMSAGPPRRIARIEADVVIPLAPETPERETLERVGLSCPVALSLHPDIEQAVSFRWIG